MRYKVGDKVRIRGDLEVGEEYGNNVFVEEMEEYIGKVAEIQEGTCSGYSLGSFGCRYYWTPEMLRPAEFKIWCETEEERKAVLEELEKEGYVWCSGDDMKKYNEQAKAPVGYLVGEDGVSQYYRDNFDLFLSEKFTPSEFTGIDFSEKIIISKTPTGATAIYGDKTVTTEGDFDDASRQALAEVLCPFKVGDRVIDIDGYVGRVKKIEFENHRKNTVYVDGWDCNSSYSENELKLYTEPLYNAKLFCVKGSGTFDKGHIYEVKDGKFTDGYLTQCKPYKDLENVNETLYAQFMEVKGGLDE